MSTPAWCKARPVHLVLITALCLALPPTGAAHKLILSVYATGDRLEGELGFSDGVMAASATITVKDEHGESLGPITTDEQGFFSYHPSAHGGLTFEANLGAGHVAQALVKASELPLASANPPPISSVPEAAASATAPPLDTTQLAALIAQEIAPLRKEIAAYKEQRDLQTLLGGIGYIVGLCGIGFYLAVRQKLRNGGR